MAGRYYAQIDAGADTAIVADTGGTTYDVSLVRRGVIPMTAETWLGQPKRGHLVGFPSVDVKSIGAGGGSIAWVDSGGLLHVGPQSAGAVPGPACYGQGGEKPTVTDAALVLGYIDPDYFLGGELKLMPDLAARSIQTHLCPYLKLDLLQAASAVMILATENMVGAIEEITIQQGLDPRTAVLVGAGGAAGLNAVGVAKRLGCSRVIIPELVAALSAQGALISDLHADYRAVFSSSTADFNYQGVNATLENLLARCSRFIETTGAGSVENSIEVNAEAHYMSQVWDIEVPVNVQRFDGPGDVAKVRQDFDRCHEELFSFRDPNSEVQFLGWRATARCRLAERGSGRRIFNQDARSKAPTARKAFFEGLGLIDCDVLMFGRLKTGEAAAGPAIIESPFTTIVIEPGSRAVKTESGSLFITIEAAVNEQVAKGRQ
ncbi:MAG: hydantoinase/oxoprolinase family protein [Pseudomonadota bacterium]